MQRERHVLEQAVRSVAKQARSAFDLIDALEAAGVAPDDEPMLVAKELRAELLRVKGHLERELGRWVLNCGRCNREVHWVSGVGSLATGRTPSPAPKDHSPELLGMGFRPS